MKSKTIITAVGSLVFLAALVVWKIISANASSDSRRQALPVVQIERPRRDTVFNKLQFNGDVVPIQQANIFSKVNGSLERIYVDMGTRVTQYQQLALIDTTELSQIVQQTGATYENARLNFERTRELAEQNLIAKQELDNADAAMKVAKANYEAAVTRRGYASITAPFSGYITKRFLDPGVSVKSNDVTLFTLMDIDEMKILVNVLEKDIPLVAKGKKAVVTVDAYPGREFYGSVTRLSQAVDLSTRTMAAEVDIPNRDHLLKPGMFSNVTLIVDEHKNALTLPVQALLKDDKGFFVYAVKGNTVHRTAITAGAEQESRVEILSGVQDADSVVTTGQQFLKDGVNVGIQQ